MLTVNPSSKSVHPKHRLDYRDVYACPICRHGEISGLVLTDAFACNFCRHIFTADLEENTLRVEDSSQPLSWRWNGRSWQSVHREDFDLTMVIWFVGLALIVFPPTLVWFSARSVPLTQIALGTQTFLPALWTGLTLSVHLILVGWLLAEHYQFPLYIASKIRLRTWAEHRVSK
jgi:hypothetical protein